MINMLSFNPMYSYIISQKSPPELLLELMLLLALIEPTFKLLAFLALFFRFVLVTLVLEVLVERLLGATVLDLVRPVSIRDLAPVGFVMLMTAARKHKILNKAITCRIPV